MNPKLDVKAPVSFGPFEFNVATGELRKHRTLIRLQGQPLQILSVFVEHPGDLIGRQDLQNRLWPTASSGDFDHGLNAAINKLRQILGDSAEQPRYIETLPGRGYRFIAPIQFPAPPQPAPQPAEPPAAPATVLPATTAPATPATPTTATAPSLPPPSQPRPRALYLSLAALAFGLLLGAALVWRYAAQPTPGTALQFVVDPPPGFFLEAAGVRQSFALSPDGLRIAFTAMDSSGLFRVFLRDFQSIISLEMPDSIGATSVFWSPDSASLFYTVRGKLRLAKIHGQPAALNPASQVVTDAFPMLSSSAFLPDGRLLLSSHLTSLALPLAGGSPPPTSNLHVQAAGILDTLQPMPNTPWPQVLPGAKYLLYSRFNSKESSQEIWIKEIASSINQEFPGRLLLHAQSRAQYIHSSRNNHGYLLFLRAGTLLAQPFRPSDGTLSGEAVAIARDVPSFWHIGSAEFSASDQGVIAYQRHVNRTQYAFVDRQGHTLSTVTPPDLCGREAVLSPDGKLLATSVYDVELGRSLLWIYDLATGRGHKLDQDSATRHNIIWAPDSQRIAYMKPVDRIPTVFLRGIASTAVETQLLPTPNFDFPTSWSRDGRFLTFTNSGLPLVVNQGQSDIWSIDLHNKNKATPLIQTPFHESSASLSPDSKWLAFTSNESGRTEIYLQRVLASAPLQVAGDRFPVSRQGGMCLRWRRDGRELFYLAPDGFVYAVEITLNPNPSALPAKRLFAISTAARSSIHGTLGFDVSADGQRFVIPTVSSLDNPALIIVRNWEQALLPKP